MRSDEDPEFGDTLSKSWPSKEGRGDSPASLGIQVVT